MSGSVAEAAAQDRLVLISGLSGSGKSTVAKSLEDLGYYCIDNLPLPLLEQLLADPFRVVGDHRDLAVVTDVRAPGFATEFPQLMRRIDPEMLEPVLLFLEASDEALLRRFSETRRPHPLAGDLPLLEAIHEERRVLAELRGIADLVLDTTGLSIHETRQKVTSFFAGRPAETPGMLVSLISFGFKHGIPVGTDLLFDVRFLPNPQYVPGLKELSGLDREVQGFLESRPEYAELLDRLSELLLYLLPRYRSESRSYLTVAVGCTGGRHRSVAMCEALHRRLQDAGWAVRLEHRELEPERGEEGESQPR